MTFFFQIHKFQKKTKTEMMKAIKKVVANSIILIFSPIKLAGLINYK